MSMVRWQPVSDLMALRDTMDRLFGETFGRAGRALCMEMVPIDMYTQDSNLVVKASVPGAMPENINVSVMGNTLTIKGKVEEEKAIPEANAIRRERCEGAFSRSVTLPNPVDASKAQATFQNGVLTLTLPVAEQAKPKEIKVQGR